jgi:putative metallohydrolase (TIGR04338 family)
MATRLRDSQRGKVYKAERILNSHPKAMERFETIPEVDVFVKKVLGSSYTRKHFARLNSLTISDGRGRRNASAYGYREISLPRWARTRWTILHELAHIYASYKYKRVDIAIAAHGREFCKIYLQLVQHFISKEAADILKKSFREHRVKYQIRKPRVITPEQREALRLRGQRLAAIRKEKLAA